MPKLPQVIARPTWVQTFALPIPTRFTGITRSRLHEELERFIDRVLLIQAAHWQAIRFNARLIGQSVDGDALYQVEISCGESHEDPP